ncbi:MAG: hypothetical protein KAR42_15230 [candidate division Zixibacteria bacterium]|nr:hypothetical protein [candidate division Zixibacteria bacterium]
MDDVKEFEYIGDGIWLHVNDHKHPTDRIYLEPQVFRALKEFSDKKRKEE